MMGVVGSFIVRSHHPVLFFLNHRNNTSRVGPLPFGVSSDRDAPLHRASFLVIKESPNVMTRSPPPPPTPTPGAIPFARSPPVDISSGHSRCDTTGIRIWARCVALRIEGRSHVFSFCDLYPVLAKGTGHASQRAVDLLARLAVPPSGRNDVSTQVANPVLKPPFSSPSRLTPSHISIVNFLSYACLVWSKMSSWRRRREDSGMTR